MTVATKTRKPATKAPATGKRTAKAADARGPKQGSARSIQSAAASYEPGELTKASVAANASAAAKRSDVIDHVKQATSGGNFVIVKAPGHDPITIQGQRMTAKFAPEFAPAGAIRVARQCSTPDEWKIHVTSVADVVVSEKA